MPFMVDKLMFFGQIFVTVVLKYTSPRKAVQATRV